MGQTQQKLGVVAIKNGGFGSFCLGQNGAMIAGIPAVRCELEFRSPKFDFYMTKSCEVSWAA